MASEPEDVPTVAVSAAIDIGFDGAAFRVLQEDSVEHRLLEAAGSVEGGSLSAWMTDRVLERGAPVVARTAAAADAVALPAGHGAGAAVACPIWVQGWIAAVLVGIVTRDERLTEVEIEAVELLASDAGLTLERGSRFEQERGVAERLEEGDRLKTEFLTTISHEMRTPLTVLMGNGRTLEHTWDALDDAGRRELLAAMNANVAILDRMVTDLLDYSRLEAGELWVSFEPFDISEVVLRLCSTVAGRRLETDIEPGLLASGDVVLIRRTVSSLLANAITHTPSDATVTVSCRRAGDQVETAVADDGPGIAEHDVPYIGERFFRGGVVTSRPKGLGLGIALARGILELHDSALVIRNRPGHGVTFSFALPRVGDPARDTSERHDEPGSTAYAPPDGGS
jgi:signal transduction histidine kinase